METYIDFFLKNRIGGIKSHINNYYDTINDASSINEDKKIFQPHQEGLNFHKLMIIEIRQDFDKYSLGDKKGNTLSLEFSANGKIGAWVL